MTDKLAWIDEELSALHDAGLYNHIRTLGSPQGAWLVVDGKRVLNLCSNNYLGLANHPRIVQAAKDAADKMGVGPGAVRTIAGTMNLHVELDKRLAKFKGVESAITFQSGFTANLGRDPCPGRQRRRDLLRRAQPCQHHRRQPPLWREDHPLQHIDPQDLEEQLKTHRHQYRRAMVITDGVFSMDGDIAPLGQDLRSHQKLRRDPDGR